MMNIHPFRKYLQEDLQVFLDEQAKIYPEKDCLKFDTHCHDYNSHEPDELWGRILKLPETWVSTKRVIQALESQGCNVISITNHNNARTCWDLLDKGKDVLVGTEFTCRFPEFGVSVHVLAYGFTPEQEEKMNAIRRDIYKFLDFTNENNIPTRFP